ncbi:MAG: hypothetical protein K9I85_03050 [Saprospiraceae bacterium]|nr:hypothetical protein [Saprospiraceae bacterium]
MDRLWFHQCIQGFLSLATIRSRDIHQFTKEHPYQSNIRFIEARHDRLGEDQPVSLRGAYHVPDRKALYEQMHPHLWINETNSSRSVHQDDLDPQTVAQVPATHDVSHESTQSPNVRLLPVYIRPEQEVATADHELDEEWEHLEERLQEDFTIDEDEPDTPEMNAEQGDPPPLEPSPTRSIFDKFDAHIDARAFGVAQAEAQLPERNFVEWLTALNEEPSEEGKGSKAKKSSRKDKKKKNKKKKEAKRLAKLSVQKKQVVATETLAELLTRQGHHKDAIDMYERLCLIFPEKKAIFAARIESIKSSHT